MGPAARPVRVWSVRGRAAFAELRSGHRVRCGPLSLTWVPGPTDEPARLAFALGRQVGGSVIRNRLRRRLRTIMGELGPEPGSYLIGAGPAATNLAYDELKALVTQALNKLKPPTVPAPPR